MKFVTLTGADHTVTPEQLIEISHAYPFVEWGILFSIKQMGRFRYPDREWIAKLLEKKANINLSAHLCGEYITRYLTGNFVLVNHFSRIQLNGSKTRIKNIYKDKPNIRNVIVGGDYSLVNPDLDYLINNNISPLFDASGGNGIESSWPIAFPIDNLQGFAGGININNLENKVSTITAKNYWIDMESSLRSEKNTFDLNVCVKILEKCKKFI